MDRKKSILKIIAFPRVQFSRTSCSLLPGETRKHSWLAEKQGVSYQITGMCLEELRAMQLEAEMQETTDEMTMRKADKLIIQTISRPSVKIKGFREWNLCELEVKIIMKAPLIPPFFHRNFYARLLRTSGSRPNSPFWPLSCQAWQWQEDIA